MKLFFLLIPFMCIHWLTDSNHNCAVKKAAAPKKTASYQIVPSTLLFQLN